ncbi:cobalamin-dependent protein [Candidatus Fermentibacteria bacterium]|nr:cobalamin-dependent protein [Candidatus Fermentibacteria bacterium]
MRVLLVQTNTLLDEPPIFPLGLAYLATALRTAGHHVCGYDRNLGIGDSAALCRALGTVRPDVVGVSIRNIKNARPGMHLSTIDEHRSVLREIRSHAPEARIVVGGSGFSLYATELMQAIPEIDLGVFGEGEESFPALLDALDTPQSVKGVLFREDGAVRFTGRCSPVPFGLAGLPDWRMFDVRAYAREPMGVAVQAKRGCALDCIHCSNHYLFQRTLRIREPGAVVDELEGLVHDFGLNAFMFADEIFNHPRSHADAIAEEMLRRGLNLRWTGWFKERGLTEESVKLWQRAGCQAMFFSPDVASNELLDLWGKGLQEEDLYRAVEVLRRVGMSGEWNFMINGPGETPASLAKLGKFLIKSKLKLGSRFRLNGCFVLVVRIYPHTRLQAYAIEHGVLRPDDDLLEPVYYNPPPMSRWTAPLLSLLGATWRARQCARRLKNPAAYRD